jgi:hypothetical protein
MISGPGGGGGICGPGGGVGISGGGAGCGTSAGGVGGNSGVPGCRGSGVLIERTLSGIAQSSKARTRARDGRQKHLVYSDGMNATPRVR